MKASILLVGALCAAFVLIANAQEEQLNRIARSPGRPLKPANQTRPGKPRRSVEHVAQLTRVARGAAISKIKRTTPRPPSYSEFDPHPPPPYRPANQRRGRRSVEAEKILIRVARGGAISKIKRPTPRPPPYSEFDPHPPPPYRPSNQRRGRRSVDADSKGH